MMGEMGSGKDKDTLEFGGGGQRPRRVWLLGGAAAVAVVIIGVVVWQQTGSSGQPSTGKESGSTATPQTSSAPSPTGVSPSTPKQQVQVSSTDLSWLHASSGYDIFAYARSDSHMFRIEVGAGETTRTTVPRLSSGGPVSFVVRRGMALVHPLDGVADYRVPDGKRARADDALSDGGKILPGPQSGELWVEKGATQETRFTLVHLDGSPTDRSVLIPPALGWVTTSADGTGGLLVSGKGGAYVSSGKVFHRVTGGEVVATGPKTWVLVECNDKAKCHSVVYDRSDGDKRALHASRLAPSKVVFGKTSPDGRTAALVVGPETEEGVPLALVDLQTGQTQSTSVRVRRGAPSQASARMAWSPDSRWLFVAASDGWVKVVNAATGKVRPLVVGASSIQQIAVRE
ncbi:MAG: hypothetical protein ACRDQA_16500 [Nocardioidaceae bacterium]